MNHSHYFVIPPNYADHAQKQSRATGPKFNAIRAEESAECLLVAYISKYLIGEIRIGEISIFGEIRFSRRRFV